MVPSLIIRIFIASEEYVGRRSTARALVIASVIIVIDEPADVGLEITRQVEVLEHSAVLGRLMPAFDLALCLWLIGCAANVPHVLAIEPFSDFSREAPGTIVAKQARLMDDVCLVAS